MGIPKELSKKITELTIKAGTLTESLGDNVDNDNLKLMNNNVELFKNELISKIIVKELNKELNEVLKEIIKLGKKITKSKGE